MKRVSRPEGTPAATPRPSDVGGAEIGHGAEPERVAELALRVESALEQLLGQSSDPRPSSN